MENNTKKEVIGFAESFYCLPHNQLNTIRAAICEEMGWEISTFNSKRNGNRKLTNPERILLKTIFEAYAIDF